MWTTRTRLDFQRNSDINSTNPNTTSHIVWRGAIPSGWRDGCPPATTLACSRISVEFSVHLSDADFVFNQDHSMGASSTNCALDIGVDVQTVAVHEFGHWGRLSHSSDSDAAMFAQINDCQRVIAEHDDNSMTTQYAGHP